MIAALRQVFRLPTDRELLQRQLDEAKRDVTLVALEAERYAHKERMLRGRIDRIERELRA